MGTSLRSQVLTHYKKLLRTAQAVFHNDPVRIASKFIYNRDMILKFCIGMTQGIRENFAHYKNVTDEKTIKEVCLDFFSYAYRFDRFILSVNSCSKRY
jgi:hypothetical protein